MTSPFSSEQLVFMMRFVKSIVHIVIEESSKTESKAIPKAEPKIEPEVEPKAAPKAKARPKRKLSPQTNPPIGISKIKKPKASHHLANTEPSKPNLQTTSRNPALQNPIPLITKKNYAGPYPFCAFCNFHHAPNTACRSCTRCHQVGHFAQHCQGAPIVSPPVNPPIQCQPPVPYNPQPVNVAPPAPRFGCFTCGDLHHYAKVCPYGYHAHLARVPHQNPAPGRALVNPFPDIKNNQAKRE